MGRLRRPSTTAPPPTGRIRSHRQREFTDRDVLLAVATDAQRYLGPRLGPGQGQFDCCEERRAEPEG